MPAISNWLTRSGSNIQSRRLGLELLRLHRMERLNASSPSTSPCGTHVGATGDGLAFAQAGGHNGLCGVKTVGVRIPASLWRGYFRRR